MDDEKRDKKQQNEKGITTQKYIQIVTGTERDKKTKKNKKRHYDAEVYPNGHESLIFFQICRVSITDEHAIVQQL